MSLGSSVDCLHRYTFTSLVVTGVSVQEWGQRVEKQEQLRHQVQALAGDTYLGSSWPAAH